MPKSSSNVSIPEIGPKVRALREKLGLGQIAFAQKLEVNQAAVARWEGNKRPLPVRVALKIAAIAPDDDREWWLKQAGVTVVPVPSAGNVRRISLLRDSAAAGTPRAIDDRYIEGQIELPRSQLPVSTDLVAVKVVGDSMSPIIEAGYIVVIDLAQHDPKALTGSMVAARNAQGVCIKWLRKIGTAWFLMSQNHEAQYDPIDIKAKDYEVLGRVVKWIGEPPKPRK